jgi:dedicator of cytokinesis protein 3
MRPSPGRSPARALSQFSPCLTPPGQVLFTPIEHAIRAVKEKTAELNALADRAESRGSADTAVLQRLLMALSGVISAGVNGGIPKYREAFLSAAYIAANPQDGKLVAALNVAIAEQIEALDRGMAIHGVACSADMRSLHSVLVEKLESSRRTLWVS